MILEKEKHNADKALILEALNTNSSTIENTQKYQREREQIALDVDTLRHFCKGHKETEQCLNSKLVEIQSMLSSLRKKREQYRYES